MLSMSTGGVPIHSGVPYKPPQALRNSSSAVTCRLGRGFSHFTPLATAPGFARHQTCTDEVTQQLGRDLAIAIQRSPGQVRVTAIHYGNARVRLGPCILNAVAALVLRRAHQLPQPGHRRPTW